MCVLCISLVGRIRLPGPGPRLMASTCMLSVLSKLSLLQLYTRLLFLQFHFVFILGRTLTVLPCIRQWVFLTLLETESASLEVVQPLGLCLSVTS